MTFRRFIAGCAILDPGWVLRIGPLRIVWAPAPDPRVAEIKAEVVYKPVKWTVSFFTGEVRRET